MLDRWVGAHPHPEDLAMKVFLTTGELARGNGGWRRMVWPLAGPAWGWFWGPRMSSSAGQRSVSAWGPQVDQAGRGRGDLGRRTRSGAGRAGSDRRRAKCWPGVISCTYGYGRPSWPAWTCLVTNGTESLCLCQAVNTTVLGLFGPTDSFAIGLREAMHRVIKAPVLCKSCFTKNCLDAKCAGALSRPSE